MTSGLFSSSALSTAFGGLLDARGRQGRREAPSGSVTMGGHAQGHPRLVPHWSFPPQPVELELVTTS
jgi:hypothetical protein